MTQNIERDELQQIIDECVGSGFIGVQLRVRDARGEWSGTAGASELGGEIRPTLDGYHRIGSNTKTFTAAIVLQLVGEGRAGLDDAVAAHLPEFGLDERITVRMLLQHTSGIFNFTGEYYEDGTVVTGMPNPLSQGRAWAESRFQAHAPEELVRFALARPARFAPGTDWSYANTNYVLLRLLIERLTGNPYAEELRGRIVEPLGLSGTLAPSGPEIAEPHAHGYYRYDGRTIDVTRHDPSWISSGGDLISTTADLQTFIAALLDGRLLPAPLVAEMCAPEAKVGYGLGVFVQDAPGGGKLITHNGGTAGHAALMYSTPDAATTLTAALNYVDDAEMTLAVPFQQVTQRLVAAVFAGRAV
ncbi:serine hydrolase domain-containing protein [Dactylosporangium sp. CS-033363]|uniref:serine hydrolase domain-containing protein n=1 Tax=Dactylosporangium sp. CS-033363 TaxID=3239935 RepID=UPI003D8C6DE2